MELEKQVCSLELAKKLKELGVKQESVFWWFRGGDNNYKLYHTKTPNRYTQKTLSFNCAAFTVAELGEMWPVGCYTMKIETNNSSYPWCGHIPREENYMGGYDTEADARAKCLIYLLEQGIIKV